MLVKGALQHHLHIVSDFLVYMKQLCIFHQSIEVFAFPSDVRFESCLIILYLKSAARSDQITDCSFAIVDWNLMSKGILYDFFPYIKQLLLHSKNFHPMLICSSFHLGLELDINLCRMVELVDRILQLAVKDAPVRNDDNGLEDLFIICIMKTAQAVGKPGDGIRFAGTGTVLDQIILPCTVDPHIREQLGHDIQLVVSREDHTL